MMSDKTGRGGAGGEVRKGQGTKRWKRLLVGTRFSEFIVPKFERQRQRRRILFVSKYASMSCLSPHALSCHVTLACVTWSVNAVKEFSSEFFKMYLFF